PEVPKQTGLGTRTVSVARISSSPTYSAANIASRSAPFSLTKYSLPGPEITQALLMQPPPTACRWRMENGAPLTEAICRAIASQGSTERPLPNTFHVLLLPPLSCPGDGEKAAEQA